MKEKRRHALGPEAEVFKVAELYCSEREEEACPGSRGRGAHLSSAFNSTPIPNRSNAGWAHYRQQFLLFCLLVQMPVSRNTLQGTPRNNVSPESLNLSKLTPKLTMAFQLVLP